MLHLVLTVSMLVIVGRGVDCGPLCLSSNFSTQLQHMLQQQMMPPRQHADVASRVCRDIQATLDRHWRGYYKLNIFGSLAAGLGMRHSDADVSVELRNFNSAAELHVLEEAKSLFMEQPTLYSNVTFGVHRIFSLVVVTHIPVQRKVDILFRGGVKSVRNTNLTRYYVHLDERFWSLTSILKLWLINSVPPMNGSFSISSYGLYLLVIFYLQQKKMVPSGYELQKNSTSYFVDDWDMGYNDLQYNTTSTEDVYQLLAGFFYYYSEFHFDEYIVSPFAGRPIKRNAFADSANFPAEYSYESLHNDTLKNKLRFRIKYNLNVDTDLCIQDIFYHDNNVGKNVHYEYMTRFVSAIKTTADLFINLSRDSILGAMFGTDIDTSLCGTLST